jgi:hypothetical protein
MKKHHVLRVIRFIQFMLYLCLDEKALVLVVDDIQYAVDGMTPHLR